MGINEPTIPEWFEKRNVFITGATGFMGKVLLVKLLTSCRNIGNIYILVREKKGLDSQARLQSMLQQEPFKQLQEKHPEYLKKVIAMSGDSTLDDLGLSTVNKGQLINEISVIFNVAANVKFDIPLKDAVAMNTKGTKNLINLAKQMKNLESLVHVSTSFTHCSEPVLEEKMYSSPMSPDDVMTLIELVDNKTLELITPNILGDFPNTYAYTKSLGEDLMNKSKLPVGVARPSIVTASWKEPSPGWVEGLNGPTGLTIGGAKGVIRSVLCDENLTMDCIPCDIVINAMIGLAWRVGIEKPDKPIYMNVTESGENLMTWGQALGYGRKHALDNPFSGILWYPRGQLTKNYYFHIIAVFFLQLLPAYFIDLMLFVTGNKPFLTRVQAKIASGLKLLHYYTMKPWVFKNDRFRQLRKELSSDDKETFFIDTSTLSWDNYLKSYVLGIRKFVLKEDPSTLPHSRKILMIYWIVDILFMSIIGILLIWGIMSIISSIDYQATTVEIIK